MTGGERSKAELLQEIDELRTQLEEERARSEEIERTSSEQWLSLTQASRDYIARLDLDFRVRFINHTEPGVTLEGLLGAPFYVNLPDNEQDEIQTALRYAIDTGKSQTFTSTHLRPDGTEIRFETVASPILDAGTITGLTVIARDISSRIETELALKASEEKYRALFEAAHDAIFLVDVSGEKPRLTECNARALEMFEADASEIIGKSPLEFQAPAQNDQDEYRERTRSIMQDAMHKGPQRLDWLYRYRDGRTLHAEMTARKIEINGKAYIQSIVHDATDRKHAEAERRRLEAQILQAQKLESLGVLAGGIAHDFNNLLMGVLANAELAATELPSGSSTRTYLDEISKAAHCAADLSAQMLAYSGKGTFVINTLDLNRVIDEMKSLLETSISKQVNLELELDARLPTIKADATQIQQVVLNLATNSSEALDGGGGTIRLRTGHLHFQESALRSTYFDDDLPAGEYAFLEVTDEGSGMDDATRAKIFDPFFTTKFTGRGLGLATLAGIVRGHHGAISVTSSPGAGTTMRVLFPATPERIDDVPVKASTSSESWRGEGAVLLVDDEESVRKAGKRLLEHIGFEVLLACDGIEALDVIRESGHSIRLVILDLTMPRMGGHEAFVELRKVHGELPVLISSGFDEGEMSGQFRDASRLSFIQKPYPLSKLREELHKALDA